MKFEIIAYYQNTLNGVSHIDKEASVPVREITKEDAESFIEWFEAMGAKRRENTKSFWYTTITDARHSTEYIFYK